MASASSTNPATPKTWSAERPELADPRTHAWQGVGGEVRRRKAFRPRRRSLRAAALFGLLLALSALLVYNLLYAPVKTPLVLIAATHYDAPLPPLDWTREDLDGLMELNERTFRVIDTSAAWQAKKAGLDELDRQLTEIAKRRGNDGAALFYVALHGVVDGDGRPCLILPGTSPWIASDWMPLGELLDHIEAHVPDDVRKIVLLDCCRIQADWSLGIAQSTFVERVERLVAERRRPDLHVLTSAGPGERSWAAPELRGSTFGRAVKMCLAGDGDRTVGDPTLGEEKIGNRNGRVSLGELHRYVASRVNDWAHRHRGVAQTPRLFTADVADRSDFRLAWTLSRGDLRRLQEADAAVTRGPDAVPPDDVAQLWRRLDSLRLAQPYRSHPLAWRDLEHGLLRLEGTSTAGSAYADEALALQVDLRRRLDEAVVRAASVGDAQFAAARAAILRPNEFESVDGARLPATAVAEALGTLAPAAGRTMRERWGNPALRHDAVASANLDRRPEIGPVSRESEFVRMTERYATAETWNDAEVVRTGLDVLYRSDVLAIGGDERAHYWLQSAAAAVDQANRTAVDRLFVGPAEQRENPWTEALTVLEEFDEGASELQQALATHDRAAAETLYLAWWFCRPDAVRAAGDADVVPRRLLPLLTNLRTLGEAIDARDQPPSETLPAFTATARALETELDALHKTFSEELDRLLAESAPSAATLRELHAALDLPLLSAERRAEIAGKAATIAAALSEMPAAAAPTNDLPPNARPQDVEGGESAAAPPGDAALQVLYVALQIPAAEAAAASASTASADQPTVDFAADRLSNVEQAQVGVRNRLLELSTMPTADEARLGDDPRIVYAATVRLLRAAAPLAFATPQVDAVARLRKFDLQQSLLQTAGRLLDDCWGGTAGDGGATPETARPFFDRAVTDTIATAEALTRPAPAVRDRIAELERVLSRRRLGARRGAATTVDTAPPEGDGDLIVADALVESALNDGGASAAVPAPADGDAATSTLPAGLGVVFARSAERMLPMSRGTWSVPPAAAGERAVLRGEVPKALGSSFEAVAMFRGNEFAAPFVRPGFGGVIVDFRPTRPDTARITLFGDRPQQSSVMFILDCSASMSATIPVEAVDADELSRLEMAKSALGALLEQLAVRADTRVGVRFFGHRVGWAVGTQAKLMTQNAYAGPIPDDLMPSADVELVLPLGRFDTVEAGQVTSRLQSVVPWGQSPLYLSLLDSLDDFDADRDGTSKSIVVVTDGANYQFTPSGGGASVPAHQTMNDVLTAWAGKNVPIYILGFGGAAGGVDEAAAREFTTLAQRTGGRFFVVENGRDLLQALRDQVGLGSYGVEGTVAGGGAATNLRLNTPKVVTGLTGAPSDFTVRFQSSSAGVAVEGGEALELFAGRDGRIAARPYDRGLPVTDVLVLDGDARRLTLRAHRPTPAGDAVRFPISIQDADTPFTPRPAEVWIEITPLIEGRGEPTPRYVFYDRRFDPNTPVPQTTCTASDWPTGSRQARVAAWYKYGVTKPFETFPLADVARRGPEFAAGVAVRDLPGIRLRVQLPDEIDAAAGAEIKVIEEHDSRSAGVHVMKVMLENEAGVLPERVVRRYDAARGIVIHTFHYTADDARRILSDAAARVALTSRSAAHEGAFHLEGGRSLTVDIAGSGDLLPLDAATGVR